MNHQHNNKKDFRPIKDESLGFRGTTLVEETECYVHPDNKPRIFLLYPITVEFRSGQDLSHTCN
ncbi:hypothetical protein [Paenibacillus assamensis]|uniref:hypothetical protein n=1 Tax=Paenibacillus assamensis TaxID=311244 RepID=UPI0012FC479A|nr:hypothetical protein [Paenibacillus assamensis]